MTTARNSSRLTRGAASAAMRVAAARPDAPPSASAASRVDLAAFRDVVIYAPPPREMTFRCEIQFHTPTVDGWLDSRRIDDFFAVYSALKVHKTWGCEPAWVLESRTCLAFQTSGQQILAGLRLKEMTKPQSVCTVFDKEECEGTKYGTYTIFIGSDYQIAVPGQPRVDKCACLVEAVKAYMASRAAA